MEDLRTTRNEARSLMEDARMMMEDAWMTVETAGILMMTEEKPVKINKKSLQESLLSMLV